MLIAAVTAATLLTRMAAVNPNLHGFTAALHAHVAMRSFPFLGIDLAGTYYYEAPDKNKVVFTSGVPLAAEHFNKLYAHIDAPSEWEARYVVTLISDDGRNAQLKLVPRKTGNVTRVDVTVDDRTATVSSERWSYQNGGYAEMANVYGRVAGNYVVFSQTGHVEEPGYVADLTSTLGDYAINPTIPDGIFESR
jgi:hypothetical protein